RERFGIPLRLQYYDLKDLKHIIERATKLLGCPIDNEGADEISRRSRGTPRIAGRLLRRCRDFASVHDASGITIQIAQLALEQLDVDHLGLDYMDQRYLKMIAEFYQGGPVGLDTISAALSEQRDTIEDVIEPYLLQNGFIKRTARGRMLTSLAYQHLGISATSL
ncbi:MAG: Holliday junction DNA helicase RuvB C-terminal domain-containing protein, partial [Pseudomonadota bacterium]